MSPVNRLECFSILYLDDLSNVKTRLKYTHCVPKQAKINFNVYNEVEFPSKAGSNKRPKQFNKEF